MNGNWYAVSRDIYDHPLVGFHVPAPKAGKGKRPVPPFMAWQWLIARANYASKRLKRGQLVVGREYLAQEWQWSEQNVRTFLKNLRAHDMVKSNQVTNQKGTLLTICNYDKYQNGQPATNQQTTINSPATNQELTTQEQITNNNNSLRERASANPKGIEMKNALTPDYGDSGVIVHPDLSVTLVNGYRQKWIERFGDELRLDLALEGFRVQEHSVFSPEVQVSRYLGRQAGDRLDRDRRYEQAKEQSAKRPSEAQSRMKAAQEALAKL